MGIVDINNPETIKRAVQVQVEAERTEYANDSSGDNNYPYYVRDGFLCRSKQGRNGEEITVRLANFEASITAEESLDDGKEVTTNFIIGGKLLNGYPLPNLEVPAAQFSGLSWVSRWGSKPTLEPGQTIKDSVRHAIQTKSFDGVKVIKHYAHTGWRHLPDGSMAYLHAGGSIGGPEGVSVKLTHGLDRYCLPPLPPNMSKEAGGVEIEALKASLSLLDAGNHIVTLPLLCLVYLAPLTTILAPLPNFSVYMYGQSGTFKTSLAVLALGHFGTFSGVESFSNFDDTVSALERRSFALKDSIHLIDDFHPSAHRHNAQIRENTVQRMIRNHSNRTARGRMNSDMTEKGRYEPRSMLLMTAEEIPALESTLARICVIEVGDGAVDRDKLSEAQAKVNLYPSAMVSYLSWIRDNMKAITGTFPKRFFELRQMAAADGLHRKLPEQVAFLRFAIETYASFLHDKGVISESRGVELVSEAWSVFRELSEKQQRRISDDDPMKMSIDMISTMLGQHSIKLESATHEGTTIGSGDLVGFWDENYIYLLPTATWHAIQAFCSKENTFFPFQRNTFFQMLRNKKIITPSPTGENTIVTKIGGKSLRVLKVIDRGFYDRAMAAA